MHGYYIVYGHSVKNDNTGIGIKINGQIKSFNNNGLKCSEYIMPISNNRFLSLLYRIPFCNVLPIWKFNDKFRNCSYLYMRRPFVMSKFMYNFLKYVRYVNNNIKIIIEIPTYPYDEEYYTYKFSKLLMIIDRYNRNRMNGLIDYYATVTDDDTIFNVPTIKISNGIDIDTIKKRKPMPNLDNTIHICAVAMFKEWHGYERFIRGLNNYYKNNGERNIICHFVGEGSELAFYKKLTQEFNLERRIFFYGFLHGKELDYIYDRSRISLGSFGMYKKHLNLSCDLKSREAIARGIPMITGCPTDIFQPSVFKYYLEFPNNNTDIDIDKVVNFYDSIYSHDVNENIIIDEIRNYAMLNISMDHAMYNVINFFKQNNK